MPNCRAAAYVLRLSLAKRSGLGLKDSSYLRRLSADVPLDSVALTEEKIRSSSIRYAYTLRLNPPRRPAAGEDYEGYPFGELKADHLFGEVMLPALHTPPRLDVCSATATTVFMNHR